MRKSHERFELNCHVVCLSGLYGRSWKRAGGSVEKEREDPLVQLWSKCWDCVVYHYQPEKNVKASEASAERIHNHNQRYRLISLCILVVFERFPAFCEKAAKASINSLSTNTLTHKCSSTLFLSSRNSQCTHRTNIIVLCITSIYLVSSSAMPLAWPPSSR